MQTQPQTSSSPDRELVITRVFNAPRHLVFQVWTQPEHFCRWLGPKDFTTRFCQMEVRSGGSYRACIRSPQGTDHWMQGIYREIIAPERLIFTFAWEDETGHPKHQTLIAITLTDQTDQIDQTDQTDKTQTHKTQPDKTQSNKTLMNFRQALFETVESRDSHRSGWSECFDRLADYLDNGLDNKLDNKLDNTTAGASP